MDRPLVSILMTAYNREKYIETAIESVLKSTYENFELIIVDDISKDNTVKIARAYASKDIRVKVYVNDSNLGDYSNRNRAASYATGKYLKYIDADDYVYPWGIQLLVEMMEQFPDAAWGLCSLEQDEFRPFPFLLSPAEAFEYNYFGPGLFHKAPLSSMIRRNEFNAVKGFSGKQHMGDYELWHLLAMNYPVLLMPGSIVWHRVHDEQQSKDNRIDPKVPFKYKVAAYHFFNQNKNIPLSKQQIHTVSNKLKKEMYAVIMSLLAKGKFKSTWDLYRMISDNQYDFTTPDR